MNTVETLKNAVRHKDAKRAGEAVDSLRAKGYTYRDCYRIGLAGDPTLTEAEWEDLMADET